MRVWETYSAATIVLIVFVYSIEKSATAVTDVSMPLGARRNGGIPQPVGQNSVAAAIGMQDCIEREIAVLHADVRGS